MIEKQVIGNATLYRGAALEILPTLKAGYNALISDPPYSSGGTHKNARSASPGVKYIESQKYIDFAGDNRDQRSWAFWCTQWIGRAVPLVVPGGYVMLFTDWRQLPTMTDVFQAGGALWRGLVVWDKTLSSRAPHTGYFRHQSEFVVWGSVGQLEKCPHGGPFPGVISVRVNPAEKLHMTGKPVQLMADLVRPLPDDANVLDPFMGSASTAIPVLQRGGHFTGIELSTQYFDVACARIEKALAEDGCSG